MLFPILVLLSALSISVVAAYYSIVGLTTLFSGAILAVTIMGIVLEIGKVVTATWLHKNWKVSPFLLKSYLTLAVIVLMFITSMGIFGYLSKAHLTQSAPISEIQTNISKLDFEINKEKDLISIEEKNISSSQKVLDQLDKSMESYFERGIISRALKEREKQKEERSKEQAEIDQSNSEIKRHNDAILDLLEQKFDLEQKIKNIEIEVGPIKYIADLVYGEEKAKDLLEHTVRYVILILIFVFDPLAVLMILAANISFQQHSASKDKNNKKHLEELFKSADDAQNQYINDINHKAFDEAAKQAEKALEIAETYYKKKAEEKIKEEVKNLIEKEDKGVEENILSVPALEAKKSDYIKNEINKEIDNLQKPPTDEDIEEMTNNILNNMSNTTLIPYNLKSGDVGASIKKIIKESMQNQFNKK